MADKTTSCLIRGCQRPASCRGLCDPCYQTARIQIRLERTTEKQLIEAGLMLPSYVNVKNRSPFRDALEESEKQTATA